ncbi:protein ccsmst1 [Bombina bombina]|uniref:protein ccsmst1 n=1 Tax=Bombina bombina TaxID=8345 RepID=UPI00235A82A6|nr:protein ccsmst1 [Bombina bombina]
MLCNRESCDAVGFVTLCTAEGVKMRWALCRTSLHRMTQSLGVTYKVRTLHVKCYPDCKQEGNSKPLSFSASKASHRHWTVSKSLGSESTRPVWKVLPLSIFVAAILIWACFRGETDIDEIIYKPIEQLQNEEPDGGINK